MSSGEKQSIVKIETARREQLYGLLGDLPSRSGPVGCELIARQDRGEYHLEKLVLELNGQEKVPAYLTYPSQGSGPWPVVLYNHAHGGQYNVGKEELLTSRGAMQQPGYAQVLAQRGVAALCIDHWLFGERRGRTESEVFKEKLWQGQVLWGLMVYDSLRALDYLESRQDMDATRIATLGISMGSTMAWWAAALDERIKVCIDLCCLTDFQALIDAGGLDGHGIYYYVPSLLKHFTTAQINALIAPRPHLALAGLYDKLTPAAGLDRIDTELQKDYVRAGAPQNWRLLRYQTGHMETAAMRAAVLAFLDEHL
jgi:dienelactone hydrolase